MKRSRWKRKETTIHFVRKNYRCSISDCVCVFIIDTDYFDHENMITMVITDSISFMILLLSFMKAW